jgi:hypothetical protein
MRPLKNPLIKIKRDSPRSGTVPFSAKKQTFSEVSNIVTTNAGQGFSLALLCRASAEGGSASGGKALPYNI